MVARDAFDSAATPDSSDRPEPNVMPTGHAGAGRERRSSIGPRRPLKPSDYDLSTGLINRQAFTDRLDEAVKYHRSHRESFALLMLQLDDLDALIALYGSGAGEQLVAEYANRLRTGVRSTDTVARIGDDRFAVILDGILDEITAEGVAERLRKRLVKPIMTKGALLQVLSDIGFALYPEDGIEASEILDCADQSLGDVRQERIRKTTASPGRKRLKSVA